MRLLSNLLLATKSVNPLVLFSWTVRKVTCKSQYGWSWETPFLNMTVVVFVKQGSHAPLSKSWRSQFVIRRLLWKSGISQGGWWEVKLEKHPPLVLLLLWYYTVLTHCHMWNFWFLFFYIILCIPILLVYYFLNESEQMIVSRYGIKLPGSIVGHTWP